MRQPPNMHPDAARLIWRARRQQQQLQAGGTCDLGGMMRLIMEVPLPLALSSALISCKKRDREALRRLRSAWAGEAGAIGGQCSLLTHSLDLPDFNLLVCIRLSVPHGCPLLLRCVCRGR